MRNDGGLHFKKRRRDVVVAMIASIRRISQRVIQV